MSADFGNSKALFSAKTGIQSNSDVINSYIFQTAYFRTLDSNTNLALTANKFAARLDEKILPFHSKTRTVTVLEFSCILEDIGGGTKFSRQPVAQYFETFFTLYYSLPLIQVFFFLLNR